MSLPDIMILLEILDPTCRCLEGNCLISTFHVEKPTALPILANAALILW
jgi:hypothetical protein